MPTLSPGDFARANPPSAGAPLGVREVVATWLPLAGSWVLMGLELPAVSAVMARLPHATVSLAAYGGVVFPLSLLVESPILMLLTASTALARDAASYRVIRRFMWLAAGSLTLVHALLAFTPLFDLVAGTWISVPEPVREPARTGLRIMLPWTLAIAYRRTQQGVLIRFGASRAVTWGTVVRLLALGTVLGLGAALGTLPGIVVGTTAVVSGVVAEALFAHVAVRPVRQGALLAAARVEPPLTMARFIRFYTPLSLTPLLNFIAMPLAAAAMSRMPRALESLATWPVLAGSTFTLRSLGFAYNEVVVALLDRPRPGPALRRFATTLSVLVTAVFVVGAVTPLGRAWFERGAGLPAGLATLASQALLWLVPMGAVSVWQSYHQGVLVHDHRTRAITESMLALLVGTGAVLGVGVSWNSVSGLHFAALGLTLGGLAQIAWLAHRSRGAGPAHAPAAVAPPVAEQEH
jgi:hypothetical protein